MASNILESIFNLQQLTNPINKNYNYCNLDGKEFSNSIDKIKITADKFDEIVNWYLDEADELVKDQNIPFILSHAVIEHESISKSKELIEYEVNGNTLYITYGQWNYDRANVVYKAKYNLNTMELIGDIGYNHRLKKFNDMEFQKLVFLMEFEHVEKIVINQIKAIMWYASTYQKVMVPKDVEKVIQVKAQNRKTYSRKPQDINLIRTVYMVNDLPVDKMKFRKDSFIKRHNKKCEYEFNRKGHWAYSHKVEGKRWWVSEATVGKGKPRKEEGNKYTIR